MTLRAAAAGDATVEVRRGAPDGELLGSAQIEGSVEVPRSGGPEGFGSAVRLNGSGQLEKVELPTGIVEDAEDFTASAWVNWSGDQTWARVFDFGSGTDNNMFLTPSAAWQRQPQIRDHDRLRRAADRRLAAAAHRRLAARRGHAVGHDGNAVPERRADRNQ